MAKIDDILKYSEDFEQKIVKLAKKDKVNKTKLNKKLSKTKLDFSNLKKSLEMLESQELGLKNKIEKTRQDLNDARSRMLCYHKANQCMDLSQADDCVFYDDDKDFALVLDNKEYHVEIDLHGDLKLLSKKDMKKRDEEKAEAEAKENEEPEKVEEDLNKIDDEFSFDEDDYSFLGLD
jgi:hypothetical protein